MQPNISKVTLSVTEFCQTAGIGRSLFYEQVRAGRIRVLKVGRRTLVRAAELAAWLDRLAVEA